MALVPRAEDDRASLLRALLSAVLASWLLVVLVDFGALVSYFQTFESLMWTCSLAVLAVVGTLVRPVIPLSVRLVTLRVRDHPPLRACLSGSAWLAKVAELQPCVSQSAFLLLVSLARPPPFVTLVASLHPVLLPAVASNLLAVATWPPRAELTTLFRAVAGLSVPE